MKSLATNSKKRPTLSSCVTKIPNKLSNLKLEITSKLPKAYRDYDRPESSSYSESPQDCRYRGYHDLEYFSESTHFQKFKFPEFQQVSTFVTYSTFLKECSVLKKDITTTTSQTYNKRPYNFRRSDPKSKSVDENENVVPTPTLGDLLLTKVLKKKVFGTFSNVEDVPKLNNRIPSDVHSPMPEVLDSNFVDVSSIDRTSLNEISNMIASEDTMSCDENLRLSPISTEDNFSPLSDPSLVIDTDDEPNYDNDPTYFNEPAYDNNLEEEKDADTSVVEMDISSESFSDHESHSGVVEYISVQDSFSYDDDTSSDESCVVTGVGKATTSSANEVHIDCGIDTCRDDTRSNSSTISITLSDNESYSSASCLDLNLDDDNQSVIHLESPTSEENDVLNISSDSMDETIDESIFTESGQIPDSDNNIKAAENTLSKWLSKTGKQVSQEQIHQIVSLFMKVAEKK